MSTRKGVLWTTWFPYGGKVRWDDLFDDLEGQFASAKGAEFLQDVGELTVAERASVELAQRLKAAGSRAVTVRLLGGTIVRGAVVDATATWIRMTSGLGSTWGPPTLMPEDLSKPCRSARRRLNSARTAPRPNSTPGSP